MSRRRGFLIWGAIGGNLLLVALLLLAVIGVLDYLLLPLGEALYNPSGPTRTSSENGGLVVTVSKSRVKVGEPVRITFTLKNIRGIARVFQAKRYLVMDIKVEDVELIEGVLKRRLYWQWSQGRELTPDLFRLELGPGESKTIEGIWVPDATANDKRLPVVGILITEREGLSPDPAPGGGDYSLG